MSGTWSIRWQTALVILLFLGSLATVLYSSFQTLIVPRQELQVRDRLRQASRRMVEAAAAELGALPPEEGRSFGALNERLREITNRVLGNFPGVEGGFYLGGGRNRFAGYGFPADPARARPPAEDASPAPESHRGDDPPPHEAEFILLQARHSLALDTGQVQFDVRTVGPSRVAIHANPGRAGKPLVKVNCAALSPTLLESEMFGHEKGAFTGAVARRLGRFEQAQGGTIFLDEIGDLDLDLQAKLLRVLQTGQFERVGGNETVQTDVRVLSATNRNLAALVAEERFRQDLYYRLNVVTLELPPLRERRDDIPLLAEHLVRRLARKYHWPQLTLSPEAGRQLLAYSWPGNVRELQNVLARAAVLARGRPILPEDLGRVGLPGAGASEPSSASPLSLKEILAETERRVLAQALEEAKWNRTRAARLLGISRRQLFDKIQQYGLQP